MRRQLLMLKQRVVSPSIGTAHWISEYSPDSRPTTVNPGSHSSDWFLMP
jgi:hypothetical protein